MQKTIYQGTQAILGKDSLERLRASHVAVIGLGGVGSWAVEALARTGIGEITLMDLDENCLSNINRQLQATSLNIGEAKVESLKKRIESINSEIKINTLHEFYDEKTDKMLFDLRPNIVLDCIDSLAAKCLLLKKSSINKTKIITCGGLAGKKDISQITCEDLNQTINDPLLYRVRKKLRKDPIFFPRRNKKFKIPCVYSKEVPIKDSHHGTRQGSICDSYQGSLMTMVSSTGIYMGHLAINYLVKE